jgi:hypothetical protein
MGNGPSSASLSDSEEEDNDKAPNHGPEAPVRIVYASESHVFAQDVRAGVEALFQRLSAHDRHYYRPVLRQIHAFVLENYNRPQKKKHPHEVHGDDINSSSTTSTTSSSGGMMMMMEVPKLLDTVNVLLMRLAHHDKRAQPLSKLLDEAIIVRRTTASLTSTLVRR